MEIAPDNLNSMLSNAPPTATHFAFAGQAMLETCSARLLEALEQLDAEMSQIGEARGILREDRNDLEREYVRLFLNPGGAPCSPWQSAHEEDGGMMGPAHVSALEWYGKYGTSPRADSEPADHAGLLLMFYAELLVAGASSDDLRAFGERHLSWLPAFAESVGREARHPFYRWLSGYIRDLATDALDPH